MSFPPIHLFYGNQPYSLEESLQKLAQKIMTQSNEWSLERFDVPELLKDSGEGAFAKVDQFRLVCESVSMFSEEKLIRIDHIEQLKFPKGGLKALHPQNSPHDRFLYYLMQYLESPPVDYWFFLVAEGNKEQVVSSPLLKLIKVQQGKIHKFVSYEDANPIQWVIAKAKEYELLFDRKLANAFIQYVGNHLSDLDQELEKLSLLFEKGHPITEEDLLYHLHSNKKYTVFYIVDLLSQRQFLPALESLNQLRTESSKERIGLFALITQRFQKLLMIRYAQQQQMQEKKIISMLGVHPFLGEKMMQQARRFEISHLERIMRQLAGLDTPLKHQSQQAKPLLQNIFQVICL